MSNEDDFDAKQPSNTATSGGSNLSASGAANLLGDEPAGSSELMCQAEDLKDLLQQIAHQISDADKRHGHALRAMQERLAAIGDRAEQVKTQVPEEFRPAFERIDEAVSLLGDRIALAERERHARQANAFESSASSQSSSSDPDQDAPSSIPPADDPAASIAAFTAQRRTSWSGAANPNATGLDQIEASASAAAAPTPMAEQATTPNIEAQQATPQSAQDDTAVVSDDGNEPETTEAPADKATHTEQPAAAAPQSIAADPTKPWDPEAAEALAELYASGPEGLPPPPESDEAETAPGADTSADEPAPADSESLQASQVDQQWLEARFADVAARVEMSLADIKPDYSMDALGQRFDQLEEQIGSALQDALSKNDIAGLSVVEEHITDLTSHLDYAQSQLARLDGIEDNLGEIVGQLSAGGLGAPSGLMADAPDVTTLAETVADRVASTVLAGQPRDGSQEQFDDLRDMLQGYMIERREGEQNTSGALDTMQAALIHLVERVDAIEGSGTQPMASTDNEADPMATGAAGSGLGAAGAMSAAAHIASASPPHAEPQEYVREAVRFKVNDGSQMPADRDYLGATGLEAAANEARGMADMAAEAVATHEAPRGHMAGFATDEALPAAAMGTIDASESAAQNSQSDLVLRGSPLRQAPTSNDGKADFIAQARRAQQLAGERMEQEELERERAAQSGSLKSRLVSASGRMGDSGPDQAAADVMVSNQAGIASAAGKAGGKGMSRTLLVACAALAVVTMSTLIAGKLSGGPGSEAKIEKKFVPPKSGKAATGTGSGTTNGSTVAKPAAMTGGAPNVPERGRPETVTDSLTTGETEAPNDEVLDNSSLLQPPPRVLSDNSAAGTGQTAATRLSHSNRQPNQSEGGIASLSSRIAPPAGLGVAVTKAALHPQGEAETAFISTGSAALQAASNRALNMPPALIGPLSLRLAASKGDPSAEFEVAARFAEGKGIMQDFSEAVRWYQRSAARGFAPAQYRLGTLYERGLGVKTDLPRARIWYLRAAKQGNVKAMHNLAVLSAGRVGAKPDYATAAQWFTEAGERGLADSQFNLGILYETGLGVKIDLEGSYKWFSLAAKRGDKQAANRRNGIRGKLSPAQLTSAERKVRSWRQTPVEVLVNDPRAAGQAWLGHANTGKAG